MSRLGRAWLAIGLVLAGLVAAAWGAARRASWIVNRLLREGATATIAREFEGAYQVAFGRLRFDWELRRVSLDSISLTTLPDVNTRRSQPLPDLRLVLKACTISGVQFTTLLRNAGLVARSFGCGEGSMVAEVPRRATAERPKPRTAAPIRTVERAGFLVFQQRVQLPSYAPRVHVARVVFPQLTLDVRLPRRAKGTTRLELERLQWIMTDLVINPADSGAALRPLFSRTIELSATNFAAHPDSTTAVRVGFLRTNLTDSTLEVRDIAFAPTRKDRLQRDLISLEVGRITAEGIDAGAFVFGQARARRIDVDSLHMEVTRDKRRAVSPPGRSHRTPQQWIADLDESLSLDSLRVREGQIVYREHAQGRTQPGVFMFARIEALATNVNHVDGRRTNNDSMTLTATTHLQDAGQLDIRAVVPLDAPQFDMAVRGKLGTMPAPVLNAFLGETAALQIESGDVTGIDFSMAVRRGVAVGTITPRFTGLAVSITRDGSEGILRGGGILGGAARRVASFVTKGVVRTNNPDKPDNTPSIGAIRHTFTPRETLFAFLWGSLREGLLSVVTR